MTTLEALHFPYPKKILNLSLCIDQSLIAPAEVCELPCPAPPSRLWLLRSAHAPVTLRYHLDWRLTSAEFSALRIELTLKLIFLHILPRPFRGMYDTVMGSKAVVVMGGGG